MDIPANTSSTASLVFSGEELLFDGTFETVRDVDWIRLEFATTPIGVVTIDTDSASNVFVTVDLELRDADGAVITSGGTESLWEGAQLLPPVEGFEAFPRGRLALSPQAGDVFWIEAADGRVQPDGPADWQLRITEDLPDNATTPALLRPGDSIETDFWFVTTYVWSGSDSPDDYNDMTESDWVALETPRSGFFRVSLPDDEESWYPPAGEFRDPLVLQGDGLNPALMAGADIVQDFGDAFYVPDADQPLFLEIRDIFHGQEVVFEALPLTLQGGDAAEALRGRTTLDWIEARGGADTIMGLAGADMIAGGEGADQVFGGSGPDTLAGGVGDDLLDGGFGHDLLFGGPGADALVGRTGHDTIWGGAGDDTLVGAGANDHLLGEDGNDLLRGAHGHDTLNGGAGNDTLLANGGNDRLDGGDGINLLVGGVGDDTLYTGPGESTLLGGPGDDRIIDRNAYHGIYWNPIQPAFTPSGNDVLVGNAGDDTLQDGAGDDTLTGGLGADLFLFESVVTRVDGFWVEGVDPISAGSNVVTDYQPGVDRVDFRFALFGLTEPISRDPADFASTNASGDLVLRFDLVEVTFEGITSLHQLDYVISF